MHQQHFHEKHNEKVDYFQDSLVKEFYSFGINCLFLKLIKQKDKIIYKNICKFDIYFIFIKVLFILMLFFIFKV